MPPDFGITIENQEQARAYLGALYSSGINNIAGLDEVGRGGLCGPVVAACVLLDPRHKIEGIRDSKKLSAAKRKILSDKIKQNSIWGIGSRDSQAIDRLNIRVATTQAAAEAALECLLAGATIDYLLCDGGLLLEDIVPCPTQAIIKGDLWIESIAAASIVAKVYRDELMVEYHKMWPEYGFKRNNGYGTKVHLEAIEKYGLTPIHRKSYGPCKNFRERGDVE